MVSPKHGVILPAYVRMIVGHSLSGRLGILDVVSAFVYVVAVWVNGVFPLNPCHFLLVKFVPTFGGVNLFHDKGVFSIFLDGLFQKAASAVSGAMESPTVPEGVRGLPDIHLPVSDVGDPVNNSCCHPATSPSSAACRNSNNGRYKAAVIAGCKRGK